ncbi:MAG: BamA/TamA family outer membrane protein [Gemmatimonadaceae bacterium]|nr:BamA/TamA family outer membrane protein [Gemmatimonadaceae bacterium]
MSRTRIARIPLLVWSALLLHLAWAAPVLAQRTQRCDDDERVERVRFSGSPVFDDLTMAMNLVTHEPGYFARTFGLGSRPCMDSLEVRRDALRLAVLHRQAGWYRADVSPVFDKRKDGVRITFAILPGPEAIIDSVTVTGLPDSPNIRRPFPAPLEALKDKRFDRSMVDTVVASVVNRLRDAGFARATFPQNTVTIDSATSKVTLAMNFVTGPRTVIGEVKVTVRPLREGDARVDSADVARLVAINPGDRYRSSAILEAQRALYRSEAFRLVLLDTLPADSARPDSVLDLRVTVAEARTRSARAGLGWATLECGRAQGRVTDRGFLGVGRRVELSARASKIFIADPLGFAPALCSDALREDPFSADTIPLNYYVGTTLSNTRLFGLPVVPMVSLYSERRAEPFAYLRETTVGALAELSRQFTPRLSGTAGYQYENGRTIIDPVVSCTRLGQCRPEELAVSFFGRGISILSTSASYDRTNDPANPSRGFRTRGELRAGRTVSEIVSTVQFYRTSAEGSVFQRALGGVFGVRVQAAAAFAPGAELIGGTPLLPQQERMFVGGQNSVRGYQQNLLGPVTYVVDSVVQFTNEAGDIEVEVAPGSTARAVPRGGTAMLVGNFEYRRNFRFIAEQFQLAAFVDAGALWETSSASFKWSDMRATPGIGLRVITPLGPFRVDIGYRPYGLRSGSALYFSSNQELAPIMCASPRVEGRSLEDYQNVIDCPATFAPPKARGVLSRLVFHFGLGQAF